MLLDIASTSVCSSYYPGSQFCWLFHEIVNQNKIIDPVSKREATLFNVSFYLMCPCWFCGM